MSEPEGQRAPMPMRREDEPAKVVAKPMPRRERPAPGTDDPMSRPGKYAVLEVPAFDGADMTSYLRLGAEPVDRQEPGEDLATMLTTFLDDERIRDPDATPVAERIAETARLHTKGGWRDHSDGNRISTTRGDKIEVIRGNHKILVLGRQDDPGAGTGWDVSGGHIEGVHGGWGGKTQIEWVQTFDGTWRVRETSEKGDTISTQHGNSISKSYGEIMDSTTGSESEVFEGEFGTFAAPNPVITDRTWATRMESYTGSMAKPVPLVSDETWVGATTSVTHADTVTDETAISDAMSSTTTVGSSMTDTTTVGGSMTSTTTVAGAMVDRTTVGTMESLTQAGTMTDITIAQAVTSVNLAASTVDLTVGSTTSVSVGGVADLTLGAMFELTLALMMEITISGTLEISLGHTLELDLAGKTDLGPSETKVKAETKTVCGTHTLVAGVANNMTAPVHNLM